MSKSRLKKCFAYVKWYADRGIRNDVFMSYEWLINKYIPALEQGEKFAKSNRERDILSAGYYLLGDVYDFMGAPMMAIKAYRRSLKYDPLNAGAHRELGNFLFNTGQIDNGISHLRKAVKLWPEDENAASDLKYALEDEDPMKNLLYAKDDMTWQMMDLIVAGEGKKALEMIRGKRGVKFHQLRTYAYGSLGREEEYLKEWEKISKLKSPVEFDYADWFFITDNLWDKSRIWDIWLEIVGRILPGISVMPRCIDEYFKTPKKTTNENKRYSAPDYFTKDFLKVINRRHLLYSSIQSAWVNKDLDALKKLYKKYPKCKFIKSHIKSLKK